MSQEVSVTIFLRKTAAGFQKLLAGIYFLLKGIPFIYQGQEIGMENMEFTSMDQIDDISTIDEYQVALRAGCSERSS